MVLICARVRENPGAGLFFAVQPVSVFDSGKRALFLMGMEKFGTERKCVIFVTHCN